MQDLLITKNFDKFSNSLKAGFDIDTENKGVTLLFLSLFSQEEDQVNYLLEKGANINKPNKHGMNVFLCAAGSDNLNTLKYIVKKGTEANPILDINEKSNRGENAINITVTMSRDNSQWPKNSIDIINYLVEIGVDVNNKNDLRSPLEQAYHHKNIDIIKCLLSNGANILIRKIHDIARDGYYTVSLLNSSIRSLLALQFGNDEQEINQRWNVFKCIFENISDINVTDENGGNILTCLFFNARHYMADDDDDRINHGDNNEDGINYVADRHNRLNEFLLKTTKYLIENAASRNLVLDINMANNRGNIPLHYACEYGYVDTIQYLLDHGAASDKYIQNKEGKTPIDIVRELDDKEKSEEILDLMFPPDRCGVKVST